MNIRTIKALMATTALIAVAGVTSAAQAQTTNINAATFTSTANSTGADGGAGAPGTAGFDVTGGTPTSVSIVHNGTGGNGTTAGGNNAGQLGGAGFETSAVFGAASTLSLGSGITLQGGNGSAGGGTNGQLAGAGGAGLNIDQNNLVTLSSSASIRGGAGGAGGNNAGGAGAVGSNGGAAVNLANAVTNATFNGLLLGGNAGAGGNSTGAGGAGGNGGVGGNGFTTGAAMTSLTFGSTVTGGNGGAGGQDNVGGAGGNGGAGGVAILLNQAVTTANVNGNATGGTGGNGFDGTGGGGNAGTGGAGGDAIVLSTAASTVNVGANVTVAGGTGGNAGTAAFAGGAGGEGISVDVAATTISIGSGATVRGGAAGTVGTGLNNGVAIDVNQNTTSLTNAGTIGAATSNAAALTIANNTSITTFTNTNGLLTSNAATGTLVLEGGLGANQTITGGTIRNATATQNAILFANAATVNNLILSSVAVEGVITGGNNNDLLTLAGTTSVSGDMNFLAGTNVLTLNGTHSFGTEFDLTAVGGTVNVATGAGSSSTFNKAGVAANNVGTVVNAGTLIFNEDFESDQLTNNGTLQIAAGKTYTTSGNMNAGGAGNALNLGITNQTTNALLSIGTNDVDLTNSTITVNNASANNYVAVGSEFLIGAGAAAPTFGAVQAANSLVADTSRLMNYRLYQGNNAAITDGGTVSNANQVWVEAERDSTVAAAIAPEFNGNNTRTLAYLDVVQTAGANDVDLIQGAVLSATTDAQLNSVLEQIAPTVDAGTVEGAVGATGAAGDIVLDRLTALRGAGAASDSLPSRIWVQAFGRTADQDRRDGVAGYDADTYGLAVGGDGEVLDGRSTLGLALSYGNTDVDSKNASNANSEIDSYQLSVYGDYDLGAGTYLEGLVGYAWNDTDTSRTVIGNRVNGDFDANVWNARAEVGHAYDTGSYGLTLVPSVSANYWHYDGDDYQETGLGGLVVDQDSVSALELGVGVDAKWHIQNQDGSKLEPVVSLAYSYDVIGDEVETTSRFVGAPASGTFETRGADAEESTFNIGAGVNFYSATNWQLTADYDYEVKSDFDAHSGVVRAGYRF